MQNSGSGTARYTLNIPPLRFFGLGLSFSWAFLMWQSPLGSLSGSASSGSDPVWILSAILSPLIAVLLMLYGKTADIPCRSIVIFFATGAATLGTVLAAAAPLVPEGTVRLVFVALGGILTGAAPMVVNTLWAIVLARLSLRSSEIVIPASFLVTFFCSLAIPNLPGAVFVATICALPLLSGFCLWASVRALDGKHMPNHHLATSEGDLYTEKLPFDRDKALKACVVLFMANSVSSFFAFMRPDDTMPMLGNASLVAAAASAASAFVAVAITMFSKPVSFDSFYRWLYVPTLAAVALYGMGPASMRTAAMVVLLYVFMTGSTIMLIYSIKLSRQTRRSVTFLFCGALAFSTIGCLVGGIAEGVVSTAIESDLFSVQTACFALIIVFSCSILLLGRESIDVATTPSSEARLHPKPKATEPQSKKTDREQWIDNRCEEMGSEYGLTNRELEVLGYLVRGRSQPYIRDALCLSQNTVASHARSIYRKLGVHSKQELLDILESRSEAPSNR